GAHPAYTLKAPASAYDTDDEYTEYASPRCSRTCWNSRELGPPPSAVLSTDSAERRGSCRDSPATPSSTCACSVSSGRSTSRGPGASSAAAGRRGLAGGAPLARAVAAASAVPTSSTTSPCRRLPAAATIIR